MKPVLVLSLVLCESLVAPFAGATDKVPFQAQKARSARGFGVRADPARSRVATLRRGSGPGAETVKRERPLTTPNSNSKTGTQTRRAADEDTESVQTAAVPSSVQTHRVARGETLERIAARYDTTVSALAALNGLESGESMRQGQFLFVPGQSKTTSQTAPVQTKSVNAAWRRYAKPPKEKGVVNLSTPMARFVGLVVTKDGRLRTEAVRSLNGLMGAGGKHPPLPERLIRLLVQVSDTFGGQAIHLVSGYRTNSYYQDSRHRLSAAVDFAIAGVPNAVVCEYLRGLEDVGVGYYPNSSFVHLDVRNHSAYWVDYAGPGEPPRSSPNAIARSRVSKHRLLAELRALVEREKSSLEQAGSESSLDVPALTVPELDSPTDTRDANSDLGNRVDASQPPSAPVPL